MRLKITLVSCLLAVVSAAKAPSYEVFIASGSHAARREFPQQVSVQVDKFGSLHHACGGSIISDSWILTAAHCVVDVNHELLHIKAGMYQLLVKEVVQQTLKVSKKIVHPSYSSLITSYLDDVALLKLERPLNFNSHVGKIELPNQGERVDGEVTLTGWGSMLQSGREGSKVLEKVNVSVIENEQCKQSLEDVTKKYAPVVESTLCTGPLTPEVAACTGDFGGPLIKYEGEKKKLVGVASWAPAPCGNKTSVIVYSRVAYYTNWILSAVHTN